MEIQDVGAVVYIREGPKGSELPKKSDGPLTLEFTNGKIRPNYHVLVIDQELIVNSPEGEIHNLACVVTGIGEPSPLKETRGQKSFRRVFKEPVTFVTLSCTIHPTELAYVTVVPNSLYSTTDRDGKYRLILPLSSGDYSIRAVCPQHGAMEKKISVREEMRTVECDLVFVKE
jgi:hypothetical protein